MGSKIKLGTRLVLALVLIFAVLKLLSADFLSSWAWAAGTQQSNNVSIGWMSPNQGGNDQPTKASIYGSGFVEPLTATLDDQPLEVQHVDFENIIVIVPAGLNPNFYDLTVQTATGQDTQPNIFEVLAVLGDLESSSGALWMAPAPVRIGIPGGIGLIVQYLYGTQPQDSVWVEFKAKPRGGQFETLGRSQTGILAPNATSSTEPLSWTPLVAGEYKICAEIDPDGEILEINENNNSTCRWVRVLPQQSNPSELVPPEIDDFEIANGAQTTTHATVTLEVTATDYPIPGASGMHAIKFIEFEYIRDAHDWVPVQQRWVNYPTPQVDYPWELSPTFGVRYIQAWAMDHARNISLPGGSASNLFNLQPSEQQAFLAQGEKDFYRVSLNAGEHFTATLTSREGEDADLYAWAVNAQLLDSSNNRNGVDQVTFKAPLRGTYQIEVHSVTNTHYQLMFGQTTIVPDPSVERLDSPLKRVPSEPVVPVDNVPEYVEVNPLYEVFLPISIR